MLRKGDIKKIGVLRANAIGDFIVTLPALEAIRHTYPDSEIVLLGNHWQHQFLEESENGFKRSPVDRVIIIPVTEGLREEKDKEENRNEQDLFLKKTREENFDILLNFQGKGIAAIPFLKKIGAKFIGGLGSAQSENADGILHHYYYQSEIARYLETASLIDAHPVSLQPNIRLFQKDIDEAQKVLKDYEVERYAVFHPSGTDKRRMWSPENFARLAEEVAAKNIPVIFTGTDQDKKFLQEVFLRTKARVIDFSGKLSLGGLGALFQKALFVVSIDTGPLHLAQAVDAFTIGLYWGPNMINWAPLSRKKNRPVVNWNLQCPLCGVKPLDPFPFEPILSHCEHEYYFLNGITTEQVMSEINYMLDNLISSH